MDREVLRKRIARNRRIAMIQNCIKVGICVAAALLIVTAGWGIAKPLVKKTGILAGSDNHPAVLSVQAGTDTRPDGTGDAAATALAKEQVPTGAVPGWQVNANGWWYAADSENCYANGWLTVGEKRYHFGADGYMHTGWTAIGNEGYYFGADGIYDPDRDKSKVIALTFDDGPSSHTAELLDILEANDARATFFLQGINVQEYGSEVIPRMAALGCTIGNHSYNHPNLKKAGAEVAKQQFEQTDQLIAQYNNGTGAAVVRFPYGEYTKTLAKNTGRACWFWDVDTLDWKTKNAQSVTSVVLDGIQGGQIVLMHDLYQSTIDACKTIIPELKSQGYELVTVQELAASRGYEVEAGVTYYGFTDTAVQNNTVTDKTRSNIAD